MIRKVFSLKTPFEILIIDDNSPDGTAAIVERMIPEFPDKLHILKRAGKEGLGKAYLAGFHWALDRPYDYIFEMDCDFSHNQKDLERLYSECVEHQASLAIGSRYISGINVVNWPLGPSIPGIYWRLNNRWGCCR